MNIRPTLFVSLGISLLLAAATLGPPRVARAEPLPDGGVTAAELAKLMQDDGYRAKISRDEDGDPKIESATNGFKFSILFYACKNGARCSSIQFYAGWHVEGGFKLEDINLWNRSKRFGQAYVDTEKDPNVEMDLDLEHGATTEALSNNLQTWDMVIGDFAKWIDCVKRPSSDSCHKDFS
jgi:hypothetical protein